MAKQVINDGESGLVIRAKVNENTTELYDKNAAQDVVIAGKADSSHNHNGVYEPVDSTILRDADIGVTVQAKTNNLVVDATYVHTDNNYTNTEKSKLASVEDNANNYVHPAFHTLADISDSGTAAGKDTGTLAGNVIELEAGSKIPAVDGSKITNLATYTNLNADQEAAITNANTPNATNTFATQSDISSLGTGDGDMLASTYDPGGVADNAFSMDNMLEGTTTKILTATERTNIATNNGKVGITAQQISDIGSNNSHRTTTTGNPHNVSANDVGLANVNNTSDANKPISDATATALSGKAATTHTHSLSDVTDSGTAASRDVGIAENNLVALDSSLRLPAVDGSLLTNLTFTGPTTIDALSDTNIVAKSPDQVLTWNGSAWANLPIPVVASGGSVDMVAGENLNAYDIVSINDSGYIVPVNNSVGEYRNLRAIGVVTEDVSNGISTTVSTIGSVVNGFSGLTEGANYYVTTTGTLTSTYNSAYKLFARAVSSTSILICDTRNYVGYAAPEETYLAISSYTANDVLNKLTQVDGVGSGLDADLLQGVSGELYAQYIQMVADGAITSGDLVASTDNGKAKLVQGSSLEMTVGTKKDLSATSSIYSSQSAYVASEDSWIFVHGTDSAAPIFNVLTMVNEVVSIGSDNTSIFTHGINHALMIAIPSTNKVLIVYSDSNDSDDYKAAVLTLSSGVITVGSSYSFNGGAGLDGNFTYDINSGNFVLVYRDVTNSYNTTAIVLSVSGTTVSHGSKVDISQVTSFKYTAYDSTRDTHVITYVDSDVFKFLSGTVSGTSISFGSVATLGTYGGFHYPTFCYVPAIDAFHVSTLLGAEDANTLRSFMLTYNGTTATLTSALDDKTIASGISCRTMYDPNSGRVMQFWSEYYNSTDDAYIAPVTVTQTTISYGTAEIAWDNPVTGDCMTNSGDGRIILSGKQNTNSDKAYYTGIFFNSSIANNMDTIGVAKNTVASGGTVNIASIGSVYTTTGLTPNNVYYVDENATLTTSSGASNKKLGKAISSTQILITDA